MEEKYEGSCITCVVFAYSVFTSLISFCIIVSTGPHGKPGSNLDGHAHARSSKSCMVQLHAPVGSHVRVRIHTVSKKTP